MRIDRKTRDRWEKYIRLYLHDYGHSPSDVTNYNQAWQIAHKLNTPREAYHIDNSVTDTHIDAALKKIMPNIQ